jgi:cytoskeletal protein RodZ
MSWLVVFIVLFAALGGLFLMRWLMRSGQEEARERRQSTPHTNPAVTASKRPSPERSEAA